jgi:hypothetical protein
MRRHPIAAGSLQERAWVDTAERTKPRRSPWRLGVALFLLGFQNHVACGGPSGPSCLDAGSLCEHDAECCSNSCRCQDMSEFCSRCD